MPREGVGHTGVNGAIERPRLNEAPRGRSGETTAKGRRRGRRRLYRCGAGAEVTDGPEDGRDGRVSSPCSRARALEPPKGVGGDPLIAAAAIVQGMTVVAGKMVDLSATERRLWIPAAENDGSRRAPHARLWRCRNRAIREWTGLAGHVRTYRVMNCTQSGDYLMTE